MSTAELLAGGEVLGAGLTSLRASFTFYWLGGYPGVLVCFGCFLLGRLFSCLVWVVPLVFVVLHLMHKDVIHPRLSPSS